MARSWYLSSVLPTQTTIAGGSAVPSLYALNSEEPLGVLSIHGLSFVPFPFAGKKNHRSIVVALVLELFCLIGSRKILAKCMPLRLWKAEAT